MLKSFEVKSNQPMYGKTQDKETLNLISKPCKFNAMSGKQHS